MSTTTRAPKVRSNALKGDKYAIVLPPDTLPCRGCGIAVRNPVPERTEALQVFGVQALSAVGRGLPAAPKTVEVTRCDDCTERRDLAEGVVERLELSRVYGHVALDKMDAALAALDLLGIRGARAVGTLTETRDEAKQLVTALAHIGAAASWSALVLLGGDPKACAPKPWGSVETQLAVAGRDEYKALVHRMNQLPFPFTPPTSNGQLEGCLLCGVGTLKVKESDAKAAWGDERRADPGTLGGRPRPERARGFLCPTCRESVDEVGAIGMAAVERAVLRHLGYRLVGNGRIETWPGVLAWAALRPGTEPNDEPWGHLDLDRLARGLDKSPDFIRGDRRAR